MKKDSNNSKLFFKSPTLAPSASSSIRHLRIGDILADHDEPENDADDCVGDIDMSTVRGIRRDGSTKLQCSSPRRIISRCLALLRRNKESKVVVRSEKREKRVVEFGSGCAHTSCSINVLNSSNSSFSAAEGEDSGQCRKDVSFNLGVGCSLLYLIAASKNELTKMVELRTQMEVLLQNVREELQTKNASLKPFEPNDNLSTNDPNGFDSDGHLFELNSALCVLPKETVEVADESSCFIKYEQEHCVVERDELEAELEVELERLQLSLDSEHSLIHPQQQKLKDLEWQAVVDTASAISQSLNSGEVIDPQEADTEINSGVSHIELERKLHELVEAKQQERIKELESALECAINKLQDKELEVSWWKDTARLISQHLPAPSQLISYPDPKILTCLR